MAHPTSFMLIAQDTSVKVSCWRTPAAGGIMLRSHRVSGLRVTIGE